MTTRRIFARWPGLAWPALLGVAQAATFPLAANHDALVGEVVETQVQAGETLLDLARSYDVGLAEVQIANPGVDPWLPPEGARVVIPSRHLLPATAREGIVVNLPELRLYYFPPAAAGAERVVMTYPLGIGAEGSAVPVMRTRIIEKRVDPPWIVPDTILAEHITNGDALPKVVPPGPDNPLGRHALRLGLANYLIHGTNQPYSVGMRVSHGCLRMYPEDIAELFPKVALGTRVRIIDQPYKAGWADGVLYLEAHPPLAEDGPASGADLTPMVAALLRVKRAPLDDPVWEKATHTARQGSGIPTPIHRPTAAPQDRESGGE